MYTWKEQMNYSWLIVASPNLFIKEYISFPWLVITKTTNKKTTFLRLTAD